MGGVGWQRSSRGAGVGRGVRGRLGASGAQERAAGKG